MTATFYVGDAIEVMNKLPEKSVDLILTSPPFLALRSYLPADHPDKALEGGSQATPGAFIDWLVDVVEACDRVLAPHGSLCIELGDTYSGSGGAGGDYGPNGLREGQPRFRQGYDRRDGRVTMQQDDYDAPLPVGKGGGTGWPLAKSLSLIPELFRLTLVYGTNPLTGRTTDRWRLRNVVRWVRPNPPVGALGDKFRPATSELMVFCKSAKRYFDLDAVRYPSDYHRESLYVNKDTPPGQRPNGSQHTVNAAGAPPLDWWNIPPGGYEGAHYAVWPKELLVKPIKAMCPSLVCLECGPIYDVRNLSESGTSEKQAVLLEDVRVGIRPVHPGTVEGIHDSPGIHHGEQYEGSSDGDSRGIHLPASASDGRTLKADALTDRGRSPQERDQERQPDREPRSHGSGSALRPRDDGSPTSDNALPSLRRTAEFLRDCPRCGGPTRVGRVLDPFGGSGTTALVATGHGRDCILVDLDERNYELALQRVGPFILERAT